MIIIRKILYIINIIVALLLGLTYLSAFIPQDVIPIFAILGYGYPFILIINVLFILLWLFIKPRHCLLSLFFILIRIDYVTRLFNYSSQENEGDLKILTYNVECFRHNNDNYDLIKVGQMQDSIANYVGSTNSDVVCFQDYDVFVHWKGGMHKIMTDSLGYHNFYYYSIGDSLMHDVAIYSKYPIVNSGRFEGNNGRIYQYIFADVKTPKETVRICNIHLASYVLKDKERQAFIQIKKGKISLESIKILIDKLLQANKKHAKQIRKLFPQFECNTMPIIIVGDFNEHPFSNTYKIMNQQYTDAFKTAGKGIGRTYNGMFPAYRIDYVWYGQNRLKAINYQSETLEFSDHYPVCVTFKYKEK